MIYISQLIGNPIQDLQQSRSGKIIDILVQENQVGRNEAAYPTVVLVSSEDLVWRIPVDTLSRQQHGWQTTQLNPSQTTPTQNRQQAITEAEISLSHDMLDKQVIDLGNKRTVRVNDICLSDSWEILGIDHSTIGLVRRLIPSWLLGSSPQAPHLLPWSQIELISPHRPPHLQTEDLIDTSPTLPTPSRQMTEMHPADIATIIHQLTAEQGARLLERLDDDLAAATLEEIETERQLLILECIPHERAAAIIQQMGPDEVADMLAHLPEERRQQFLRLLSPEESEDVQELLAYEADTAGGLMTTDYIVLNQNRTAQEALNAIRHNIIENDVRIAYIYCVLDETTEEHKPVGVVSLWDILGAEPDQTLETFMESDVISVSPDASPGEVTEKLAKYNLLAVPVINEEGFLQGIVTVDDALDTLLPPDRRRPRRMY